MDEYKKKKEQKQKQKQEQNNDIDIASIHTISTFYTTIEAKDNTYIPKSKN